MARVKFTPGLDCTAAADQMVRLVLRTQLEAMCALRKKALNWDDVKGVHDMRVLSRRLRSAVSDFKPFLIMSGLPRVRLREIARSLGAVRDEDVALSALDQLKTHGAHVADALELFAQERCKKREEARARLKSVIGSATIKEFRREFLTKVSGITIAKRKEDWSFGGLGTYVIHRRLKEMNEASRCVYLPFAIKEIHDLRILTKRLRYALELFSVCWGSEVEVMAQELSLMQDTLGALHDCDVWIELTGTRLVRIAKELKPCDERERLRDGAQWLLAYFVAKRAEHYRDTLTRWRQWEVDGFLQKLELLVCQPG